MATKKLNEVSSRLKESIAESVAMGQYTYSSLARKINATPQAVRQWAVGINNVSDEFVEPLSRALGKSESWARAGIGEEVVDINTISVPQIDVSASAGFGAMIFEDDQVLKRIDLDAPWLRRQCSFSHPDKLSVITASGDSMQPTIAHGDFLLVDQGIDSIRSDSIYVAVVNGNLYVKRFQQTPRNTLLMISDNTAYAQFELDPDKDEVRVIGQVIYQWHGEKR